MKTIEGRPDTPTTGVTQPFASLLDGAGTYRKRGTVTAVRMDESFTVYTSTGEQTGQAGDYLVSNGSEAWPVPADYFEGNYEPADGAAAGVGV